MRSTPQPIKAGRPWWAMFSAFCLVTTTLTEAAFGQANSADSGGSTTTAAQSLGEVVVTAERREENLQDVPLAVSTLSGQDLELVGAHGFDDLTTQLPGVMVNGFNQGEQFTIRGIATQRSTAFSYESAGIYFGDIPVNLAQSNPDFASIDMARVEVLRGPQSTLFGAGAESGVVRFIPQEPIFDQYQWFAGAEGSGTAHGGGNSNIYGIVNAPLSDTEAAIRLLAYYRSDSGYIDDPVLAEHHINSETTAGYRAQLKAQPADGLSVNLTVAYQKQSTPTIDYYDPTCGDLLRCATVNEPKSSQNILTSATITYDLSFATLTSVTGYLDTSTDFVIDGTIFPLLLGATPGEFPSADLPTTLDQDSLTQEFRLTSPRNQRFWWTAGAFYSKGVMQSDQYQDVPGIQAALPTLPPASSFGLLKDWIYSQSFDQSLMQLAGFGDATWAVIKQLELTAGIRFFHYRETSGFLANGVLNGGPSYSDHSGNENGTSPRLNVLYHFDDDRMAYIEAAKGFRPGIVNGYIPTALCGSSQFPPITDPDYLWNYEVGTKTQWFDRRLTLNADAYDIQWKNIVVQHFLSCGYSYYINAGQARSRGAELEANMRINQYLSLYGNYAYTDATLTKSVVNFGNAGDPLPYAPKNQLNIGADFQVPVSQKYGVFGAVDATHVSTRTAILGAPPAPLTPANTTMPGFASFNARTGLQTARWSAYAFAENVNNARGVIDATPNPGSAVPYAMTAVIRPRTVGIRFMTNL